MVSPPKIKIQSTDEDLEYWFEKNEINEEIKNKIKSANIVVIPESYKNIKYVIEDFLELQDFLREEHEITLYPLCNDDEFNLLRQESSADTIKFTLEIIVLSGTILGWILAGIKNYLLNKKLKKETEIKLTATVDLSKGKSKNKKKIEYEGSPENLEKILDSLKEN
ncbi:hypothetical protein [Candidatus Lokiarchaeum ossiferum]|uniref:hypothetical protein n=1 Tax=Candidatus Lokiarchaeum ossiferum TaxID=2951803 RepID=UPI00352DFB21